MAVVGLFFSRDYQYDLNLTRFHKSQGLSSDVKVYCIGGAVLHIYKNLTLDPKKLEDMYTPTRRGISAEMQHNRENEKGPALLYMRPMPALEGFLADGGGTASLNCPMSKTSAPFCSALI